MTHSLTGRAMTEDYERRLLKKDVEKYTNQLRTNPLLEDLRQALRKHEFTAEDILLAGYLEDEDGVAVGAIVSSDKKVYEFEHHESHGAVLARFDEVSDPQSISSYIYAVNVALELAGTELN